MYVKDEEEQNKLKMKPSKNIQSWVLNIVLGLPVPGENNQCRTLHQHWGDDTTVCCNKGMKCYHFDSLGNFAHIFLRKFQELKMPLNFFRKGEKICSKDAKKNAKACGIMQKMRLCVIMRNYAENC